MGTSTSSAGAGVNVPLTMPWEDKLQSLPIGSGEVNITPETEEEKVDQDGTAPSDANFDNELSPPRRYASARRELRKFATNSEQSNLKKAIGNFSKSGFGGAKKTSRKMKSSTRAATNLISMLLSLRDGNNTSLNNWAEKILNKNPSAEELIDAIIYETTTSGGTVDEESIRDSMAFALSDLMNKDHEIDLFKMSDNNIWSLIELFLANEVKNKLIHEIGQLFEGSKNIPSESIKNINMMRKYLQSEISDQLSHLRKATPKPSLKEFTKVMDKALENTFTVYEGAL